MIFLRRMLMMGVLLSTFLLPASIPSVALAQDHAPADVHGWVPDKTPLRLPDAPTDYVSETIGKVTWDYPRSAQSEVLSLAEEVPEAWRRIRDDLGVSIDSRMRIRVGRNPSEMKQLAPIGSPPPDYAAGVAYPGHGLILLTLTAPTTWKRPAIEQILVHELSHIALARAVKGQPVPRWYVEGLAIYQASEHRLERMQTLWNAVDQDNVFPITELEKRFPSKAHQVDLAYAQSADLVSYMRRSLDRESKKSRSFIQIIRRGDGFETALQEAYFTSIPQLEKDWRRDLEKRHSSLPLILGGSTVWVIGSLVLLLAWLRRRWDRKRAYARWEEQEQPKSVPQELIEVSDIPRRRDPAIPTIEFEGQNHTLH